MYYMETNSAYFLELQLGRVDKNCWNANKRANFSPSKNLQQMIEGYPKSAAGSSDDLRITFFMQIFSFCMWLFTMPYISTFGRRHCHPRDNTVIPCCLFIMLYLHCHCIQMTLSRVQVGPQSLRLPCIPLNSFARLLVVLSGRAHFSCNVPSSLAIYVLGLISCGIYIIHQKLHHRQSWPQRYLEK